MKNFFIFNCFFHSNICYWLIFIHCCQNRNFSETLDLQMSKSILALIQLLQEMMFSKINSQVLQYTGSILQKHCSKLGWQHIPVTTAHRRLTQKDLAFQPSRGYKRRPQFKTKPCRKGQGHYSQMMLTIYGTRLY